MTALPGDVTLTKEEADAAVAAALARKSDALRAEDDAKLAADKEKIETASRQRDEAKQATARKSKPEAFIGIDLGGDARVYLKNTSFNRDGSYTRDRTVAYGTKTYEHHTDDADGVWLYRHLG